MKPRHPNAVPEAEEARRMAVLQSMPSASRQKQADALGLSRDTWVHWLAGRGLATRKPFGQALSAAEVARRERIAVSHFSRAKQAQRAGMVLGSWMCWVSDNGFGDRAFQRYPTPSPAEVAERLRVAALAIPRAKQARMLGMKCNTFMCWLSQRHASHGDVPEFCGPGSQATKRLRLAVEQAQRFKQSSKQETERARRLRIAAMDHLTRREQAALAGVSAGAWSFWLSWIRKGRSDRGTRPRWMTVEKYQAVAV